MKRSVLFLALSLTAVGGGIGSQPSNGDVLVTADGTSIQTDGPWEVKGRQVVFTSEDGRLSALRLSEVDLEASHAATELQKNPPAPAPPPADVEQPRREPVLVLTNDDIGRAAERGPVDFSHVTATSSIRAVIEVHGCGYEVSAALNGQPLSSIDGEMNSEIVQVFHVNHPQKQQLEEAFEEQGQPQELRSQFEHFSLLVGSNQIDISYQLVDESAARLLPLRIVIKAPHYSVPILEYRAEVQTSGGLSTSFEIRESMPAGFTTRTLG